MEDLCADRLEGAAAIARYQGTTRRRVYHLAKKGALPGTYWEGDRLVGSKSAMREAHERKARGQQ
jgi:hypothetical protein